MKRQEVVLLLAFSLGVLIVLYFYSRDTPSDTDQLFSQIEGSSKAVYTYAEPRAMVRTNTVASGKMNAVDPASIYPPPNLNAFEAEKSRPVRPEYLQELKRLEAANVNGGAVRLFKDSAGLVRSIAGEFIVSGSAGDVDPNEWITFLEGLPNVVGLGPQENLSVSSVDLASGIIHIGRQYKGLPVWGRELVLRTEQSSVTSISGVMKAIPYDLDLSKKIMEAEFRGIVSDDVSGTFGTNPTLEGEIEEGIYLHGGLPLHAYRALVDGGNYKAWWVYVGTNSGSILSKIPTFYSVTSTGTDLQGIEREFNSVNQNGAYDLIDLSFPDASRSAIVDHNYGREPIYSTSAAPEGEWDPAAVSAIYNSRLSHDYFKNTHDRSSYDGSSAPLLSIVNFTRDDQGYDNAYWYNGVMVYGIGGGAQDFRNLAISLDVAAHELTHGVVEHTSNLVYKNQSGALNESFADFFGVMVERENWLIGEDLYPNGGYMRSLKVPESRGQPSNMVAFFRLPEFYDNGGVHVNSGIPNKAFYLLAEGLTSEGIGTSIGLSKTETLAYRTLLSLGPNSDFLEAAIAMALEAEALYGTGSLEAASVLAAWSEVGVSVEEFLSTTNEGSDTFEIADGDELFAFLIPRDGTLDSPLSASEEYDVYVSTINQPYQGYVSETLIGPINDVPAAGIKPTSFVTASGTAWISFVSATGEVRWSRASNSHEDVVSNSGLDAAYISRSPDGSKQAIAEKGTRFIWVYDYDEAEWTKYEALGPSYAEEATDSAVSLVDSVGFDHTGNKIIFDYLNCIPEPGAEGGCADTWGIGVLDLNSGFEYPFPSQKTTVDLGFPKFARTRNDVFVFDALFWNDFETTGKAQSAVLIYNTATREFAVVANPNVSQDKVFAFGMPSFVGADEAVSFNVELDSSMLAWQASLDTNNGMYSLAADPYTNLLPFDSGFGHPFRKAYQDIYARLQTDKDSVSFGVVEIGSTSQQKLVLSNDGVRELSITEAVISGVVSTNLTNIELSPGQEIEASLSIDGSGFEPGDLLEGTISIQHTGDNPAVTIGYSAYMDLDTDGDGIFNSEDPDDDGDGVNDSADAFPMDPAASIDTDGDGMPDDWNEGKTQADSTSDPVLVLDDDDDDDGVKDSDDPNPTDPALGIFNYSIQGNEATILGCLSTCPQSLIIPDSIDDAPVRAIADSAFRELEIETVSLPDSLRTVGNHAFRGNLLTSIELPTGLTELGSYAFYGNVIAGHVSIPSAIRMLQTRVFSGNDIASIALPEGLIEIGSEALSGNQLTDVRLPSSIEVIGSGAFRYNQLVEVEIPEKVSIVESSVFWGNSLESVSFPQGLIEVKGYAFYRNNLTHIDLPNGLIGVGGLAFSRNQLASLELPAEVSVIGREAFQYNKIDSLSLPSGVLELGDSAFADNIISDLSLNNGLLFLGQYAFARNRISSVVVPSTLKRVNVGSFFLNPLSQVTVHEEVEEIDDFAFAGFNDVIATLPAHTQLGLYSFDRVEVGLEDSDWEYDLYHGEDYTKAAITGCTTSCAPDLVLPDAVGDYPVTIIGQAAFSFEYLTSIKLPAATEIIAIEALLWNDLETLTIPAAVRRIGDEALAWNFFSQLSFLGDRPEFYLGNPFGRSGIGSSDLINFCLIRTGWPGDTIDGTTPKGIDCDSDGDAVLDSIDLFPFNPADWEDSDLDGVGDNTDNCSQVANTDQLNTDGDSEGNACDADDDNDEIPDDADPFPLDPTEWADFDGDGAGNNADTDDDNDEVLDADDAFPFDGTEAADSDGDGIGNNADTDDDNDGVLDADDAFPLDSAESIDTDGDGIGNNSDPDDDNDEVLDVDDAFPINAAESVDTDGDGTGNNADADDDNDNVLDASDAFPLDPTESVDTDGDGTGNNADADDDNDEVLDVDDAFPLDSTESVDNDGDGIGNNSDPDDDNDEVLDEDDAFPFDAAESVDTDDDGTGNNADADDDNDEVLDVDDAFPLDSTESVDNDGDGIGNNSDPDDDNDDVLDVDDAFPFDAAESVDTDGDGTGNNADADDDNDEVLDVDEVSIGTNPLSADSDSDGIDDGFDAFPLDSGESADSDFDGVGDNADLFPLDAMESQDSDGDGVGDNSDLFDDDPFEAFDSDLDGIGNNADSDDDNDGYSDEAELAAGTDPFDAGSCPECVGSDQDGDGFPDKLDWSQIGANLIGDEDYDGLGFAVSISGDGEFLAVGATGATGSRGRSGIVRIFRFVSGDWVQIGSDIDGEAGSDAFGSSVSISADGQTVAVGALDNDGAGNGAGHVRVFYFDGNDWIQIGTDIDGEKRADSSGSSVSLSDDGSVIAIGARGNDEAGSNAGHVRIFEWQSNGWVQVGTDIDGSSAGDSSGYSVALSGDGQLVAIGSPNWSDGGNGYLNGQVRVFTRESDSWVQVGQAINSLDRYGYLGTAVSLSAKGDVLALGAGVPGNAGRVRVFQNIADSWVQMGADLGEEGPLSNLGIGDSVALSDDGMMLAIGASYGRGGLGSGFVLEWNGEWSVVGDEIKTTLQEWGLVRHASISISGDGERVALGVPGSQSRGIVEVFRPLVDAFPLNPNENSDSDKDGVGDNGDIFPMDPNESVDTDGDGIGNNADIDDDNDDILDEDDAFPLDYAESIDADGDGIGDNADPDDDNDGVRDLDDALPLDPTETLDSDSDGVGDNADADDDNDGIPDTDDAFPYDAQYSQDDDQDGLPDSWEAQYGLDSQNANDAFEDTDQDGYLNWEEFLLETDPTVADGTAQLVFTDKPATLIPGRVSRFTVQYSTVDENPNLSGLGLRVHYNSNYVTSVALETILETGFVAVSEPEADTFDLDGDAETDQFILISWASFSGPAWPGEIPKDLFDVVITTTENVADLDFYPIRFSIAASSEGYTVSAPSVYNPVILASLDIDGDGEAKALTDGLMVIRRLFGFSGDVLISGAVSSSGIYQGSEEIVGRLDSFSEGLDVDADGQTKALTDGLMIIRRLFGFSGSTLVTGAVSNTGERTDPAEIADYIDSLSP